MPHSPPLPRWLKRNVPKGNANHFTARLIDELKLQTVCDHAKCPNRMECYAQKTATFMILGDTCTRACRFCSVPKGRPQPPDLDEPRRVAEAVVRLGLKHVVVTCVTRDDLPDGGAEHYVKTIAAIRAATDAVVEVLPSDFNGNPAALDRLIDAAPGGLQSQHGNGAAALSFGPRPAPKYPWTLTMFRRVAERDPTVKIKSGLMLGIGETHEELLDTLADLHDAGVRWLTLGQYLQPSLKQMAVVRYLPVEEFAQLGEMARQIGFTQVASGPLVRSSYHARKMTA